MMLIQAAVKKALMVHANFKIKFPEKRPILNSDGLTGPGGRTPGRPPDGMFQIPNVDS
jgi:hypothetical protein